MAGSIFLQGGGAYRCVGALAPTTVVGNSVTARERFLVEGAESINVRYKGSSITSDPTFQIIAQDPTTLDDDGDVNDVATGHTALDSITTSVVIKSYTILGERYVDVVVVSDSGDVVTVDFVDVYVKRR